MEYGADAPFFFFGGRMAILECACLRVSVEQRSAVTRRSLLCIYRGPLESASRPRVIQGVLPEIIEHCHAQTQGDIDRAVSAFVQNMLETDPRLSGLRREDLVWEVHLLFPS